jgi:hypothetical protein
MRQVHRPRTRRLNRWPPVAGKLRQTRVIELVAGSVAESLLLPGKPWLADSVWRRPPPYCDRESISCALTEELLIRRSMTGIQVDEIIAAAVAAKSADDECKRRRRLGTAPIIHRAFRAVSSRSS